MLNKHQKKTEATKSKLFAAARRVFAKRGFEAASIGQVARTAGFSRGAFYAHFRTKEDLFLAMLEDRASESLIKLRSQMDAATAAERSAIMQEFFRNRLSDTQWSILQIEFKLFIARQGARGAKLAERYQSLRDNLKQQYVRYSTTRDSGKHAILEALTDGLSLQRAYKGALFPESPAEEAMRQVLDLLLDFEE